MYSCLKATNTQICRWDVHQRAKQTHISFDRNTAWTLLTKYEHVSHQGRAQYGPNPLTPVITVRMGVGWRIAQLYLSRMWRSIVRLLRNIFLPQFDPTLLEENAHAQLYRLGMWRSIVQKYISADAVWSNTGNRASKNNQTWPISMMKTIALLIQCYKSNRCSAIAKELQGLLQGYCKHYWKGMAKVLQKSF